MYAEPLFLLIAFVSSFIGLSAHQHNHKEAAATSARLQSATNIVWALPARSQSDAPTAQAAQTDCVAVIPGFSNDTRSMGMASGQGFITCRVRHRWSAPAAIMLESSSPAMLADGGRTDVILLLKGHSFAESFLSGAFVPGDGVEEASGGKLFFRQSKHTFAKFTLPDAVVRPDTPINELLYGRPLSPSVILDSKQTPPTVAQDFVSWVEWRFR
jgi:lipid-binding SYLF domain-containing protein